MKSLISSLAALALLSACQPAFAASCAPRQQVVESLEGKYKESRVGVGMTASGTIVETYVNAETGTWTITNTNPNGLTCLVAAG